LKWFSSINSTNNSSNDLINNRRNDLTIEESKYLVLKDFQNSVDYIVDEKSAQSLPTNDSCNHFNCFDVYRCGNHENGIDLNEELISVYIYPSINYIDSNSRPISSRISEEFWELLKAITDSPYYTSNPSNACLFIPNIDFLNQNNVRLEESQQILASLSHWNQKGTNHLIFNMISGSFPDYNTRLDVNVGNAIIAGAGFDSWTYRPTFDVPIPFFSIFSDKYRNEKFDENSVLAKERKWFIVCAQIDSVSPLAEQILIQLESQHSDNIIVLGNQCSSNSNANTNDTHFKMCNNRRKIEVNYPEILTESTFCLIMKTPILGHPILSDSLMSGCIPVIIIDNYILPFEEKIDWKRFSIRIWEHSLNNLFDILKSFSQNKIIEMREQTVFIWKSYFSSMKAIAMTTLKIINERIFPNSAQPSEHWNKAHSSALYKEYALISPKLSSRQSFGFTAVILTYDRLESLYEVIRSVVKAVSCVKVLVIWNNQPKSPPQLNKWPNIRVPLQVIVTKENKLSNRFYPYDSIDTDAILAIDDDIVMLTPDELEFGYQVWREFPDRIVGFPSRVHRWDNKTSKWKYESEWTNDVSMVLTGAAFYHKVRHSFLI
jgi:glucuronyl/N-acetylglucosaminyl transferase EXT2